MKSPLCILTSFSCSAVSVFSQIPNLKPEILGFEPFIWPCKVPVNCPFKQSEVFNIVQLRGIKSGYQYRDSWCPTWASNDTLYSPWIYVKTKCLHDYAGWSKSWVDKVLITIGQGIISGDGLLTIKEYSIGLDESSLAAPSHERYPCGSLVYNRV